MPESLLQLTERMTAAFDMARDVHADQTLKGTDLPYLLHLLDACSIALRHGADEDQAIAALLHDVVEDGGGQAMLDDIEDRFGERVRQIVYDCSDSLVADPTDKPPWWQRKIQYLDHLRTASHDTALVTGADKLSNARSLVVDVGEHGDTFWERFTAGRPGSLWYYRRIVEILPARLPETDLASRLAASLRREVDCLLEIVGHDQADHDWKLALASEADARAAMAG